MHGACGASRAVPMRCVRRVQLDLLRVGSIEDGEGDVDLDDGWVERCLVDGAKQRGGGVDLVVHLPRHPRWAQGWCEHAGSAGGRPEGRRCTSHTSRCVTVEFRSSSGSSIALPSPAPASEMMRARSSI
jgi:hypothetical protein